MWFVSNFKDLRTRDREKIIIYLRTYFYYYEFIVTRRSLFTDEEKIISHPFGGMEK